MSTKKEVVEKEDQLPTTIDDGALDALIDSQSEGLGADAFAIPFFKVLQTNSPTCDPSKGEYNPDAKPGQIMDTVSKKLYDEIHVVRAKPGHCYLEWRPNRGGFAGKHTIAAALPRRHHQDDKGVWFTSEGNELTETLENYVLALDGDDVVPGIITLSSTQFKYGKNWNTNINADQKRRAFVVYKLSTFPESNESGSWFSWKFERERELSQPDDNAIFAELIGFKNALDQGNVQVDESQYEGGNRGEAAGGTDDIPF